jgi:hypothetical protein
MAPCFVWLLDTIISLTSNIFFKKNGDAILGMCLVYIVLTKVCK